MTLDLPLIEATARAATPGPWKISTSHGFCIVRDIEDGDMIADMEVDYDAGRWEGKPEDARHIALCSPSTILTLVERIRSLEAGLAEACDYWRGMYQNEFDSDGLPEGYAELRALVPA